MATLELPLADPRFAEGRVVCYRIPVRPIYRQYPVYAPDREPSGYMDGLEHLEPDILWDGAAHHQKLEAKKDFIKAGSLVFQGSSRFSYHAFSASPRNFSTPQQLRPAVLVFQRVQPLPSLTSIPRA